MKSFPSTIPYGLVDLEHSIVWVNGQQNYIYCLDLHTGMELAKSSSPMTILTGIDGQIIGWTKNSVNAHSFMLQAFALEDRRLNTKWKQTIQLPEWVNLNSASSKKFSLESKRIKQGLSLIIKAQEKYAGGAPPSFEIEQMHSHSYQKTININLLSGEIAEAPLDDSASERNPSAYIPKLPQTQKIVAYRQNQHWTTGVWYSHEIAGCLVSVRGDPGIFLKYPNTDWEDIKLSQDQNSWASVSPDGAFIFVHEPSDPEKNWKIFATESGQRVAQLYLEPETTEVAVVENRLFYVVATAQGKAKQHVLHNRDITSGELAWSHLLKTETYLPPAPLPP